MAVFCYGLPALLPLMLDFFFFGLLAIARYAFMHRQQQSVRVAGLDAGEASTVVREGKEKRGKEPDAF